MQAELSKVVGDSSRHYCTVKDEKLKMKDRRRNLCVFCIFLYISFTAITFAFVYRQQMVGRKPEYGMGVNLCYTACRTGPDLGAFKVCVGLVGCEPYTLLSHSEAYVKHRIGKRSHRR